METEYITDGNIPVIVHIPHNGLTFPPRSFAFGTELDNDAMEASRHVLADLHVDELYTALAERLQHHGDIVPYTFTALLSRLFVDMERFDDEREEMNERGMGVVYTNNHNMQPLYDAPLSRSEKMTRKMLYSRYHNSFEQLTEHLLAQYGTVIILDLHSYATEALAYELHSDELRTPLVLGTDEYHSGIFADVVESATHNSTVVSENTVFCGTFVPMRYYQQDDRVQSIMAEVRKDVYLNEATLEVEHNQESFDQVVDILENLVLTSIKHAEIFADAAAKEEAASAK